MNLDNGMKQEKNGELVGDLFVRKTVHPEEYDAGMEKNKRHVERCSNYILGKNAN